MSLPASASASAASWAVEAETDSPMHVRDQHYDFDFDSEDAEHPSPAAALLPSIRQPMSGSRSSPLCSPSPPPLLSSPLSRSSKAADEQEEHKEHLHSSSSSPPPPRDSPSPLISPTSGESRQERQSSPPVRRMTANGVVLSSAALQSLSSLKQRRRTRAASAVEGRPRRDSGGDGDSRSSIRGSTASHHSYSRSHHFPGGREDDDDDDDDDDAEERRRTEEQRRRRQHIADQEEAQERRERDDAGGDDSNRRDSEDDEERLPPLHSSSPSPHVLPMSRQSSRHASLLYAATPSPTPSVPLTLPSAAPRPRTRAASAFPALSSHSSSASSSLSSTMTTSTLSQPEVTFTASEALQAVEQPGSALSHLPRQLQSSDWSSRFDGLTCLRRLLLHHPQLLSASTLKPLLRDVRGEVDSLRSLLAKNAISCLALLFASLPRLAEAELPLLLPPLLKRAGETSGAFLAEEAERALAAMAERCCEAKALTALVNCAEKGNKVVRMQAVQWLGRAVEMRGGREMTDAAAGAGDAAKVLKALGVGCGEAGASVRGWCKRGLQRLGAELGWDQLEQALRRVLSSSQMAVVKKQVLDRRGEGGAEPEGKSVSFSVAKRPVKGRAEVDGSPLSISGSSAFEYPKEIDTSFCLDSTASSLSPRSSSSSASASSPCKPSILKRRSTLQAASSVPSSRSRLSSADGATVVPPAELLPSIVADMTSADWRTRLHSIEGLTAFCSSFSLPAASAAAAALLVDPLFSLIQDNNGKVIIAAMQSLPQLLPTLLPLLPTQPLLLRLTANLASSNITVRSLASSVLDLLPALCEDGRGGLLMQPYCQCLLYGNAKIRLLVLEKIVELVARGPAAAARGGGKGREKTAAARTAASASCSSPSSLSAMHLKWAIPVCFLWPDESRAEMKALLHKLTMLVYAQMGSDMLDPQLMLSLKLSTAAVKKMQAMLDIH